MLAFANGRSVQTSILQFGVWSVASPPIAGICWDHIWTSTNGKNLVLQLHSSHLLRIRFDLPSKFAICEQNSGYNESILRSKRHQLNECARNVSGTWIQILTVPQLDSCLIFCFLCFCLSIKPSCQVSPGAQLLHFKKYNHWWATNARKVKRTMRARLRWNEEQWCKNVDHCCICTWVLDSCAKDSKVHQLTDVIIPFHVFLYTQLHT